MPVIAIIGRPNVGKSSLFNRLLKKKMAIVDDIAGVTRDRREASILFDAKEYIFIDTPGLCSDKEVKIKDNQTFQEKATTKALVERMTEQTIKAVKSSDVILYVYDAKNGVIEEDKAYAKLLYSQQKKVLLIANKSDQSGNEFGFYDGFSLGFGDPIAISAAHGHGIAHLWQEIFTHTDDIENDYSSETSTALEDKNIALRISIVGRPNVGKSTLMNCFLNEERTITGPEAGITRDAISANWSWNDKIRDWKIKLWDTAGLRKRNKATQHLEKLANSDTIRAIAFSEVIILLFSAQSGIELQERKILQHIINEGRAFVLVANKWDIVEDKVKQRQFITDQIQSLIEGSALVPFVTISALKSHKVHNILPEVIKIYKLWNTQIKTKNLIKFLQFVIEKHPPPNIAGRSIRLKYMAQIATRPPRFIISGNRTKELPDTYRKYITNKLKDTFDLSYLPIRINYKSKENPFDTDK